MRVQKTHAARMVLVITLEWDMNVFVSQVLLAVIVKRTLTNAHLILVLMEELVQMELIPTHVTAQQE